MGSWRRLERCPARLLIPHASDVAMALDAIDCPLNLDSKLCETAPGSLSTEVGAGFERVLQGLLLLARCGRRAEHISGSIAKWLLCNAHGSFKTRTQSWDSFKYQVLCVEDQGQVCCWPDDTALQDNPFWSDAFADCKRQVQLAEQIGLQSNLHPFPCTAKQIASWAKQGQFNLRAAALRLVYGMGKQAACTLAPTLVALVADRSITQKERRTTQRLLDRFQLQ